MNERRPPGITGQRLGLDASVWSPAAGLILGYTNIKHLPAGISGWVKAGEPTDKGS
ncbi:MAG TPA: hypothetical protein VMV72_20160 [Verrucomicrobiae bacterium]|nr:hypothetical protein [Verrucomicrobiae bacterium]